MKISVIKKIGKDSFAFEAEGTAQEALMGVVELGRGIDRVTHCGKCQGTDIRLASFTTKEGYNYVRVICNNEACKASNTAHFTKDGKTFWFNEDGWEIYQGGQNPAVATKAAPQADEEIGDLPF